MGVEILLSREPSVYMQALQCDADEAQRPLGASIMLSSAEECGKQ